MSGSLYRRAASTFLALALLGAALPGCNCGGPKLNGKKCTEGDCCTTNQDCVALKTSEGDKDPKNWFCDVPIETCFPITKVCTDQGQCCPGQICSATIGQCVDSYTSCMTSADCYVAGQVCNPMLGSFPSGPGCTFATCNLADGNADCGPGLSCFNGYCVGQPPCSGGCPGGEVCTPVNNQCFKLDNPTMACQQTCAPGYLLVFTDGQNVFNLCDPLEEANCQCEALPAIQSPDLARFSSAAVAGSNILVSAYDGQYGDLVLHTFDKTTLAEQAVEWIDGVPTPCTPTGDPNGARGGCSQDGPDVGRYTSIAYNSSNNTTHIAYYAYATSGSQDTMPGTTLIQDLKYATRSGTGTWTVVDVDGSDLMGNDTGEVGMYTSITISPDGAPVIAYFQSQGVGASATISAIKVARGKIPQPQKASDFTISTIETEAIPSTGGADGGVSDGGTAAKGPIELLPGDGLFTGIAYINNEPIVVWYDHTLAQLKGIIAENDSAPQGAQFVPADIKVLDDGTMNTPPSSVTHDVGRYASIAIGPSSATKQIAIAYMDETSYQLKLITAGPAWAGLMSTVVDTGMGTPTGDTVLFVGSSTSVSFLNGLISIAYQDQTTGSLRWATQPSATAPVAYKSTLDQDGTGGFYARLVNDGTNMFATHAVIKANLVQSNIVSGNQLRALKVQ